MVLNINNKSVRVFGPAYLDRVLRIDQPLLDSRTLDRSVDGFWKEISAGPSLKIEAQDGAWLIEPPQSWPGPWGVIELRESLGLQGVAKPLKATDWLDDLGGMGAGYAKALGGTLVCGLGKFDDPLSESTLRLLDREQIACEPVRVVDRSADWTLLLTSGGHGDKLAIGFRGCHSALVDWGTSASKSADLILTASLTNNLALGALRTESAAIKVLAPSRRNLLDPSPPIRDLISLIDGFCCNREEWSLLADSDQAMIRREASLVSITNGAAGSWLSIDGQVAEVAAFPRKRLPIDTNRAGEAYGSELIRSLLDRGWTPWSRSLAVPDVRQIAIRASAAAALVLDWPSFGFPARDQIDHVLRIGHVE